MTKSEKITRLEKQVQEWTERLNRSRKPSLRHMRALHRDCCVAKLRKLQRES